MLLVFNFLKSVPTEERNTVVTSKCVRYMSNVNNVVRSKAKTASYGQVFHNAPVYTLLDLIANPAFKYVHTI